ncbi:MAG: hypothetical protein P4L88_22665 [Rhodoferax sp.]|nr:hypothetical protein [Rhodoferax sp.]
MTSFPPLPRRLGIAADMTFIVESPIGFIADCLLIYDQIVIPGDPLSLANLYGLFGTEQMQRMFDKGRLCFCPAMSRLLGNEHEESEFSRSKYISLIEKSNIARHHYDDPKKILAQVDSHLLVGSNPDYKTWKLVKDKAVFAFNELASRPEYEFLMPLGRYGVPNLDRLVGLETGMARLNDLAAAGVLDIEMDAELPWLLNACFPGSSSMPIVNKDRSIADAVSTVEKLHGVRNLPSLGQMASIDSWTASQMLDIAMSDDADELRDWLRNNLTPGLDVRDAYIRATETLPSKMPWTGWLRFGAINTVTTTIGAMVGNPILGAGIGLALSAADQQFGPKLAAAVADPYHPGKWLSLAGRGYIA